MKAKKFVFGAVCASLILTVYSSCNDLQFYKTKGGMPYKIYHGGGEKKVTNGAYLKYHVINKLNDSVLFDSHIGLPGYFRVDGRQSDYNITEILTDLKKGDSVYAVQMVDSLIKKNPGSIPPFFKKGDRLITILTVLDVIDSTDAYLADMQLEQERKKESEVKFIEDYLSKNNIKSQQTPSGTFVSVVRPGTGALADSGTYVSVMYTGQTFDGTVFDSNMDSNFHHTDPIHFTVGQHEMIAGFDEGIRLLHKGAKARLYVPSMQAYGANPGQGSLLKPFDNVIFDVELLDVQEKDSTQSRGPQLQQ